MLTDDRLRGSNSVDQFCRSEWDKLPGALQLRWLMGEQCQRGRCRSRLATSGDIPDSSQPARSTALWYHPVVTRGPARVFLYVQQRKSSGIGISKLSFYFSIWTMFPLVLSVTIVKQPFLSPFSKRTSTESLTGPSFHVFYQL